MKILFNLIIFFVYLISFTEQNGKFSKTKNVFEENIIIKTGDIMQCEITKTDVLKTKNSIHVFSHITGYGYGSYSFYPIDNGIKCISFDVRTRCFAHIAISDVPHHIIPLTPTWTEIVLQYSEKLGSDSVSVIRKEWSKEYARASTPNIVSENELRGFWIRWTDDHLIEVGRKSQNIPFMSYRSPTKLAIKYIGLNSFKSKSEWILHGDSNCPIPNQSKQKIATQSNCFILS